MKKTIWLAVCLLMAITVQAQTQQGIVKTRGRMVNGVLQPGVGLQGATVQVKDRSAVVSGTNGKFSFPLRSNTYLVQSVKKQGFQLVDMEACRSYTYSSDPLYFVMETPEQQRSDLIAAEGKIRRNLRQQLQQREDEIEALRASQQEKDSLLRILYQQQTDNEKLISDMAKRYSTLDYDQLDEFYRQVSWFIENGELTRADSMLRTRGDINAQVQSILQHGQAIQQQEAQLQQAKDVHQADIDEAARRCYSYYETFFAQHQNDSAAYYLEQRIRLDSMNIDWLAFAGDFVNDYIADYNKAMYYYDLALKSAKSKNKSLEYSNILCSMADVYVRLDNYNKAMELYKEALELQEKLNYEGVAHTYCSIGTVYYYLDDYSTAIDSYLQGITCVEQQNEEKKKYLVAMYMNLSEIYQATDDNETALKYAEKAKDIALLYYGKDDIKTSDAYNNLGVTYKILGETSNDTTYYGKARDCYNKALKIRLLNYGENHPGVAVVYNNISSLYSAQKKFDMALEYGLKDLEISIRFLGEINRDVATSYCNIGLTYKKIKRYDEALKYYEKALSIRRMIFTENSVDVAMTYNNLGALYYGWNMNEKALEYFEKTINILIPLVGEDHRYVKTTKNHIARVKKEMAK